MRLVLFYLECLNEIPILPHRSEVEMTWTQSNHGMVYTVAELRNIVDGRCGGSSGGKSVGTEDAVLLFLCGYIVGIVVVISD